MAAAIGTKKEKMI